LLGATLLFFILPRLAFAQAASIAGAVKDSSGAALPGVTVEASSPALIEKSRTVITDGAGEYKIIDLRPGTYKVSFTLPGFASVVRDGIELSGSFTATVNADLKVGAITETVTVTSEAPTVDVQNTLEQKVLPKSTIDALPAGRSHLDEVVLIPGAAATVTGSGPLMDVGGTNNLKNTTITLHGNSSADTRVLIDGAPIRNIGSQGQYSNFVPDTGATQEVQMSYSGVSAEVPFGGLLINLVPRAGGNSFHGSAFGTGANSSFQGNNYTPELQAAGLSTPNSLYLMYDINGGVGGPIVKDRLWFYSSARAQTNQYYIAGVFANANAGNPNAWTYVPDTSSRGKFYMNQPSLHEYLTWQASPKNKINVSFGNQGRTWNDERALVSPEAITDRVFTSEWIGSLSWSSTLTNKLLLEAHLSNHSELYHQLVPSAGGSVTPNGAPTEYDLIPVTEQSTGLIYRAPGLADPCCFGNSSMPAILSTSASLSYVTGAHAFKVGFQNISGQLTNSEFFTSTNTAYRFNNGIPNQITEYGTPFGYQDNLKAELGIYAQDKWTVRRLTLTGGVRFDYMNTYFPVQTLGPASLVPNRNITFPETPWDHWKDLSPRIGGVYDLTGDGKTAIKASLNRYVLAGDPTVGNPVTTLASNVTRSWNDANSNFVPDCNLLNPLANGECGTISDLTFGSTKPSTVYDPKILNGWAVRPFDWEFTAGVQRQLMTGVGIDVSYFHRWYGNFTLTDNTSVAPSDFSPFSIVAPVNPLLPGGGAYTIGGLYNLNPNKVGQVSNFITAADNFGKQQQHWDGVDVIGNVRLSHGVLLQGGVDIGRTMTDSCSIVNTYTGTVTLSNALGAVQSTQMCHLQTPWQPQVKFLGTYSIPKIDVRLAATLQSAPGPIVLANYIATNAVVQPSLGRPLSGGAANTTVNLVAPGAMFGQRANQVDLRFTKTLKFGPTSTSINLDLANLFNANAVLTQNNNYAAWQVPTNIMDPRLFKISAQFEF
jgi:hypothetical protein